MARIRNILIAFTSIALTLVAWPAAAAGGTLSAPATSFVGSQYVTITADGPLTFTTNSTTWSPSSFLDTGGCHATIVGTYTNPPQHLVGTCTAAGTLTGWLTNGSIAFTTDSGQVLTLTDTLAPPQVTPPPAPAPAYTITRQGPAAGTYTVTITNTGNAAGTNYTYSDTTLTPPNFTTAISAPGFTSCGPRYARTRTRTYQANGFVCTGANLPAGASTTIVVTS